MTRRILLAVHGEPASDAAVRMARAVAVHWGAAVDVLTVLEPLPTYGRRFGPDVLSCIQIEERREHLLRERVHEQLERVAGSRAFWPTAMRVGVAGRTIAHVAGEVGAALIVLGIGRHEPADRLLGGETVLKVARHAPVPVLAVARGSERLPRHVVVATDFSDSSAYAARAALELLDSPGRLSLVHVRADVELPDSSAHAWQTEYRRAVDQLMARSVQELAAPPSVTVEPVVLEGKPARELVHFADRVGADLIAAGSQGLNIVERILLGSVSMKLLRSSCCSVLLVPAVPAEKAPSVVTEEELARLLEARGSSLRGTGRLPDLGAA